MLRKLLKYDLIGVYKFLIIFYCLALFFSLLTRIFLSIDNSLIMNIIGQICSGTTISMIFSIVINNLMRFWVRFRQNLYGDESYLTHTLPIPKKTLYLDKILSAIITLFTSILVIALALFIAYYSKENLETLKKIFSIITNNSTGIIVSFLFILFLEFINILQCGYSGIILGHKMNNGKIGYSVLFGFIVFLISQMIVLLMIFIVGLFDNSIMNLIFTNEVISFSTIKTIIYMALFMYMIIIVVGYFINLKLFKTGVNVD